MGNVANRHRRFASIPSEMLSQHFSPMVGATVAVAVAVEEALKKYNNFTKKSLLIISVRSDFFLCTEHEIR